MNYKKVILNPGKERPIQNRHHWIFSGAIKHAPDYENGEIMQVYSANEELVGHASFNKNTVIAGRMINFDSSDPMETIKLNIQRAIELREKLFDKNTNTYRLINGEGDGISGLVVDRYNDVLVLQIVAVGIDQIKMFIVETLKEEFKKINKPLSCVYEKSTIHARRKEGLQSFEGALFGKLEQKIEVLENGVKFLVDVNQSQKTGLFLDQREMRKLVGEMARGKNVLNTFSYTGGFSLYAMKGGAKSVTSVDIAAEAIELSKKNFELNGFNVENNGFVAADAFRFLHDEPLDYDFIILDPPAFAKKKEDLEKAKRGYGDINRTTLRKMPVNSFLLTCSCSYHVPEEIFEKVVMAAARDAGRNVRIVQKHRLAMDHPINIYHSEIDYLKGLLLYVD